MTVVIERLTCRTLAMIGGVGFSLGVILASQAKTLAEAILYIGVLTGVANAFQTGPYMVMLGAYFHRRYAVASGIAVCGGSLGQFALPPILRYFIDVFAFRGAVLIFGGLILNCVVCGALMRPVAEYTKRRRGKKQNKGDYSNEKVSSAEKNEHEVMLDEHGMAKIRDDGRQLQNGNVQVAPIKEEKFSALLDSRDGSQRRVEEQYLQLVRADPPLHLSSGNLYSTPEIFSHSHTSNRGFTESIDNTACVCTSIFMCRCCSGISHYCSILKNPLFLLVLFSCVLGYIGVATQVVFIPPHAKDVGLSNHEIPPLISVMGGCDLAGRILIGLLVDSKLIASYRILSIGYLLLGLTAILTFLARNFWGFVAVSISYGICGGIMYSLIAVVLTDFFGSHVLPRALGVTFLFQGSALCAGNPFLGWLRDMSGSYVISFCVIGGILILAGATLLFVPLFRKWMVVKCDSIIITEKDYISDKSELEKPRAGVEGIYA
ncbi:monocarboxylate transporter 12-like [Liolophura sinensis]|uniref:monocarboxylate transporter 12-like n=1 Tax=Liolophura sinensis TaxID=3198878 RepID=UPI0031586EDB